MELILYTLRMVSYAIIDPMHIILIIGFGIIFYFRNRRISFIQKVTMGEYINSPMELTLSQIALGIIAGAIISIILSGLGVIFYENSGIEILFFISVMLLFIKKRFFNFSYSAAILGALSIVSTIIADISNTQVYLNVNILYLMTFVAVFNIVEGLLILFDGSRGAIPVFTNRGAKIVGGFSYSRNWAMPIAIFIAITSNVSTAYTSLMETENWWPLINREEGLSILALSVIAAMPLYCISSYKAVSFTRRKKITPMYSGVGKIIYGIILVVLANIFSTGIIGQIVVVVFTSLGYELLIRIQQKLENKGECLYITDENGVSVLEVVPNSQAYLCGFREGDKILEVNEKKVVSEVEVFKQFKENISEISFKVKKISGEIVDLKLLPKKKVLGILLVPRMVEKNEKLKIDDESFKEILEEMKKKKF